MKAHKYVKINIIHIRRVSVIWWVVSQKTGSSALNLKNAMNFGSYETSWAWLQKLRRIMIRPERDLLCGTVEVDETYIGTEETGVVGRKTENKVLVAVAVEEVNGKIGRVRFRCIKNASSEELTPFIIDNIDINSDEYSFRFNRRLSKHRGKLFYRIMQQAVIKEAVTMDEFTGKKSKHNI
jgi:hypothetical protein